MAHQTSSDQGLTTADDTTSLEKGLGVEDGPSNNNASVNDADPNMVDWDGPNDPENPMNWPESRKWIAVATVSVMSLVT